MRTKAELRLEIEETRERFHQLLDSIPAEAFQLPSDNPAWTIGEVLYHMSIAPRFMGRDLQIILNRPILIRILAKLFPESLFHWLNARLTRYGARNLDRTFLANEYDKGHENTLIWLDKLSENDLAITVTYPSWDPLLSGDVSIAYLFGYIKMHFDSHASQIEEIVATTSDNTSP